MKQTLEAFEAKNLEYENLYNEEDERREYNSIWYNQVNEHSLNICLERIELFSINKKDEKDNKRLCCSCGLYNFGIAFSPFMALAS